MTGVAQVKVMKAEPMLMLASEQFLGKAMFEMEETILQTLEGHLRAILGTLTVEEVYANREVFAQQVAIFCTFCRIKVYCFHLKELQLKIVILDGSVSKVSFHVFN